MTLSSKNGNITESHKASRIFWQQNNLTNNPPEAIHQTSFIAEIDHYCTRHQPKLNIADGP